MAPEDAYSPPNEMPPSPIHPVLVGQKALVTGASKGLGQAMAIGFAQAGADVLVNYSSDEAGSPADSEDDRGAGTERPWCSRPIVAAKAKSRPCSTACSRPSAGSTFAFPTLPYSSMQKWMR